VAPATPDGGNSMNDIKSTIRDKEADAKEAWRKADGDESLGDKAANIKDRTENAIKDTADDVQEEADRLSREDAYIRGRTDERDMSEPR
jgi:hypothetical protein